MNKHVPRRNCVGKCGKRWIYIIVPAKSSALSMMPILKRKSINIFNDLTTEQNNFVYETIQVTVCLKRIFKTLKTRTFFFFFINPISNRKKNRRKYLQLSLKNSIEFQTFSHVSQNWNLFLILLSFLEFG